MHLPYLQTGEFGVVDSISGQRSCAKRLADIGFVPGARIEMLRSGDPCIVRLHVDGTCVGLGGGHQESILLLSP